VCTAAGGSKSRLVVGSKQSGAGRWKHDELGMWESKAVISLLVLGVFRVSLLGEQFPAIDYN
jgi:hypothetical protein